MSKLQLQIDPQRIDPPDQSDQFDNFCRSLGAAVFDDPAAQRIGRSGQSQDGVDIVLSLDKGKICGIQSKKRDQINGTLSITDIQAEVVKAKEFNPGLSHYIIATTLSKDAKLQEKVRLLSSENQKKGLFSIQVWFWDDIKDYLHEYDVLYKKWYPENFPETSTIAISGADKIDKTGQKIIEELIHNQAERKSQKARMDLIREMIEHGNPETALRELEDIEKNEWENSDDEFKFRILTNKGASKSLLEDYNSAAKYFLNAYKYDKKSEKALSNVALAYSLLNEHVKALEAIEFAIKCYPESERAKQLRVHIFGDLKKTPEDIFASMSEDERQDSGILLAVASVLRAQGLYLDSIKTLEQALKLDSGNKQIEVAMAEVRLQMVIENESFMHSDQMTDEIKDTLESVADTFKNVWREMSTKEVAKNRTMLLFNASLANLLLRNLDIALVQITEALERVPKNAMYIKHQAIVLFEMGSEERAIEQIKSIDGYDSTPEISIPLIGVLAQKRLLPEARDLATRFIKNIANENAEALQAATLALIKIYISLNEYAEAKNVIAETRDSKVLKQITIDILEARVNLEEGTREEGLHLLQKAKDAISETTTECDLVLLADELYAAKQYSEAGDVIERYVEKDIDSEVTRKLLNCYYNSNKFKEALDLAKNITEKNMPTVFLTEIQSLIYEKMGDLPNAKIVCKQHLEDNPSDFTIKIRYMSILLRSGTNKDTEELDSILNDSSLPDDADVSTWAQFINLYEARSKYDKALQNAYELLRTFFSDPDAHMLYIGLVLRLSDELPLLKKPKSIDIGSAIKLDNGAWYIFEDRINPRLERGEINTQHALAKHLKDKKLGEEIVLSSGNLVNKHKIVEIKNKFLYALHDSMEGFEMRFPETPGFFGMQVDTVESGDKKRPAWMTMLLKQVEEKGQHIKKIEKFYKEGKLTIGAFAHLAGGSIYEVWSGLMTESEVGIRASSGTVDELRKGLSMMHRDPTPRLIIDPVSLMTMHGIGIADDIVKHFGKIGISRSVVDSVAQSIADKQGMQSNGYMSVSKQDAGFVRTEISAADIADNVTYLQKILAWINDAEKCQILPVDVEALESNKKIQDILGETSLHSINLAGTNGYVLYSDDERLRSYARNENNVDGVWTQVLLIELLDQSVITSDKYAEVTLKLIDSNYHYTSINKDVLLKAAQKSKWELTGQFAKVMSILRSQESDITSSVTVVAEFWRDIHLLKLKIPRSKECNVYYPLLSALTEERDTSKVLALLRQIIEIKMGKYVHNKEDTYAIIRKWEKEYVN